MPELPAPLQNLAAEGAQIRYLGEYEGLDGWITIKKGQEQYFYVTPDGKSIIMGLLFNDQGKLITARQIQSLQQGGDSELLDMLAENPGENGEQEIGKSRNEELRTPSEKLFVSVVDSNWIVLGDSAAPEIYVFADPRCPHSINFVKKLKSPYIDTGKLQVRLVPVGFSDESMSQAAFLLAAPDAEKRWYKYISGDKTALPAKEGINTQGVLMNLSILQAWKFEVTPLTLYRSVNGRVKLIRGEANDIHAIFADLER